MRELLGVFLICMILAIISEFISKWEINSSNEKVYFYKEKVCFFIMATIMAGFVGLRTWYNDTTTYKTAYEMMDIKGNVLECIEWSIGENPGFNLFNYIMRIFEVHTQSFFMIYALITLYIYLWFIRKYTNNIWLTVFLFFTMGCYTFTFAAIKQCVAVAFCLVAVDRAICKKYKSFVFWVLLASTFHPYALMYLAAPFLTFSPWSRKTYLMLGAFGVAGLCLEQMLGTIVNITTMMGEEYDMASFTGDGVNVIRLAVIWAPSILSIVVSKFLCVSEDRANNLIVNFSMLNAEIMFVALFGTANYFARLANYFLIFQTVALVWILRFFNEKSRKLLVITIVGCYLVYFYYANAINQPFDEQFSRITIGEYLNVIMSGE